MNRIPIRRALGGVAFFTILGALVGSAAQQAPNPPGSAKPNPGFEAPACRAVVAARRLLPKMALSFKARVSRAFYAENRDMTSAEGILEVAEEADFDRTQFADAFAAPETHNETFRDFLTAQELGIRGFPTLIAGSNEKGYALLTNGYRPLDDLAEPLERWLAAGAPIAAAAH